MVGCQPQKTTTVLENKVDGIIRQALLFGDLVKHQVGSNALAGGIVTGKNQAQKKCCFVKKIFHS